MVNNEKILKQKNSLRSGINIRFWLNMVGLALVAWLIWSCGATFSAVVGVYLGYKLLRLVLRIFGLLVCQTLIALSLLYNTVLRKITVQYGYPVAFHIMQVACCKHRYRCFAHSALLGRKSYK